MILYPFEKDVMLQATRKAVRVLIEDNSLVLEAQLSSKCTYSRQQSALRI